MACVLFTNKLLIFSGRNEEQVYQDVWEFSLDSSSWRQVSPYGMGPPPLYGHEAVLIQNSQILLFGGDGDELSSEVIIYDILSD